MQSLGRNKYDESIVISVMFLHSPLTLSSISLRHLSLALDLLHLLQKSGGESAFYYILLIR